MAVGGTSSQAVKAPEEKGAQKSTKTVGNDVIETRIALRNVALCEFDDKAEKSASKTRVEHCETTSACLGQVGTKKKTQWHKAKDVGKSVAVVSPGISEILGWRSQKALVRNRKSSWNLKIRRGGD
jgi:hypothetical protein